MDKRIGKHGEKGYRPEQTIMGRVLRKATARAAAEQIFITRNLGDDYYAVIDPGIIPGLEEMIDELRKGIPHEPKRQKHLAATGNTD